MLCGWFHLFLSDGFSFGGVAPPWNWAGLPNNVGFHPQRVVINFKYQPSGAGGPRSPPATTHRLQYLTPRLIQNGRRGLERGQTFGYLTLRSTFAK